MPKVRYIDKKFTPKSLNTIVRAIRIIEEFASQGYDLTLRQLYYQFVARGIIPNRQREYHRLGSLINDARLAGMIDWNHIVDRTRFLRTNPTWDGPADIIRACAQQYRVDLWEGQSNQMEVWIEKDALMGVFARVCQERNIPHFSCRGYTSQSEMWAASQRLMGYFRKGQTPVIIHFGDHDPSGIDMSRDITDRINMFIGPKFELVRVALNMDQVEQYDPPPNPAKLTDSRCRGYIKEFGPESWELDALDPSVLTALVIGEFNRLVDERAWEERKKAQEEGREKLRNLSDPGTWSQVEDML